MCYFISLSLSTPFSIHFILYAFAIRAYYVMILIICFSFSARLPGTPLFISNSIFILNIVIYIHRSSSVPRTVFRTVANRNIHKEQPIRTARPDTLQGRSWRYSRRFWMIYAIPSDEIYQPTGVFWYGRTFSRLISFDSRPGESRVSSLGMRPTSWD